MKTFEIRSRYDAAKILYCGEHESLKEAVEAAVKSGDDLSGADLSEANLSGADLYRANLSEANLIGAYLSWANLSEANLCRANLSRDNHSEANLARANLSGADLSMANLSMANLSRADLSGADLYGANLSGADLSKADLSRASLSRAENAELVWARTSICPEGQIIGWKKCKYGVIVKLSIPEDARRSNATGRKCRAEFADVLEIFRSDAAVSLHDGKTSYRVGERVTPHEWCEDRWQECAGGIHFYITREEAEAHS